MRIGCKRCKFDCCTSKFKWNIKACLFPPFAICFLESTQITCFQLCGFISINVEIRVSSEDPPALFTDITDNRSTFVSISGTSDLKFLHVTSGRMPRNRGKFPPNCVHLQLGLWLIKTLSPWRKPDPVSALWIIFEKFTILYLLCNNRPLRSS